MALEKEEIEALGRSMGQALGIELGNAIRESHNIHEELVKINLQMSKFFSHIELEENNKKRIQDEIDGHAEFIYGKGLVQGANIRIDRLETAKTEMEKVQQNRTRIIYGLATSVILLAIKSLWSLITSNKP